jgi:hypothetical protein
MKSNHDNGIWDEHRWESHINEIEQKSHQLRSFLDTTLGEESPRWYRILKQSTSEQDALDSFIEEELLFDEAYFPDDDDDWDLDDEDDDDIIFGFTDEETKPFGFLADDGDAEYELDDEEDDDDDFDDDDDDGDDILDEFDGLEEGEEWKLLSEEYAMTDSGAIENLNIYNVAHSLGIDILKLAEQREELHLNKSYNQFVSDVLQISTKIAAGYSLGFEFDMIGGNIAYNKKGLYAANRALATLQTLKTKTVFPNREEYFQLHAKLFELRNDLGIYIQDLRDLFNNENI